MPTVFRGLVKKPGVSSLSLATLSTVTGMWEQTTVASGASVFTHEHGGTDDFNINTSRSTYSQTCLTHFLGTLHTWFFKFLEEDGWNCAHIQRKKGSEKLSNLPKDTQPVSGRN